LPTRCSDGSPRTGRSSWTRCGSKPEELRRIEKIVVVACGSLESPALLLRSEGFERVSWDLGVMTFVRPPS